MEAALLVEDARQGHGLGTRLPRHLGRHAYGTVTAWVHVPDLATALPARRRRAFFRTGRR
ncbi:hypothetical protein AB0M32_00130 [Streptomyces sp. NPDC051985]|uniref:hypothetical protein n=1 Tax=Streptomyces sp. NPDC051985 TaxID=3155807 RepID=UPI0034310C05